MQVVSRKKNFLECFQFPFYVSSGNKSHLKSVIKDKGPIQVIFFLGYLGPTHHHVYQLVQLARLQKESSAHLHIVVSDVLGGSKRHTNYAEEQSFTNVTRTESHLNEINTVLLRLGVPSSKVTLYQFSTIWATLFNQRKDLLLYFYNGLNELPNELLDIPLSIIQKFHLEKGEKYNIGYVIQKYAVLFFSSYFREVAGGSRKEVHLNIFGEPGNDIIEKILLKLNKNNIFGDVSFTLTLDAIPTFGTNKSIISKQSIPTAGMSIIELMRICKTYSIKKEEIREIYEKFISIVSDCKFQNSSINKTYEIFAKDLKHTFDKLLLEKEETTELTIFGLDEMEKIGSLLRSENVLKVFFLCDGKNSISEIATKIDKQVSNVSKIVKKLKDSSLIEILSNNKPIKAKKSIKILLSSDSTKFS